MNIQQIKVFQKPIRLKNMDVDEFLSKISRDVFSKCIINDKEYIRSVALNPMADIEKIIDLIKKSL